MRFYAIPRLPHGAPTPKPFRSFLRSRSHPKPRRNLRSRYANMMESIHPRADRRSSSDCGSSTARRTRSFSIPSPSSLTNPTTPYQDRGKLGTGFSVLKSETSRNQTPGVSSLKILGLPPWLQDTITELDASHPLRAVFPTIPNVSDSTIIEHSLENQPDYPTPRSGDNRPFFFPSTPPRIPSKARHQGSDTSSDEPREFSAHYPLYHNSLLHLQPGSPTLSAGAHSRAGVALPIPSHSRPSSPALTNVTKTPHICGSETTPLPASSSNCNIQPQFSPARRNPECDDIFRYDPSRADQTTVPSPKPFVFQKPTPVYFDSPIEDPISSDPLEQNDYDPFRLGPEECNNLSFKWTPFDLRTRERRAPTTGELETGIQPPDTDEVIVFDAQ